MTVPDGSRPGLRPVWQRAALLIAGFVALLYAIEAVDAAAPAELDSAGIEPRSADGLWGVVFAPVLHADWAHLSANTIPLLVLGFLVLVSGIGRGLAATAIIWIVGGLGTWLTAGAGFVHIGASILVFGWLTYLITRGIFNPAGEPDRHRRDRAVRLRQHPVGRAAQRPACLLAGAPLRRRGRRSGRVAALRRRASPAAFAGRADLAVPVRRTPSRQLTDR